MFEIIYTHASSGTSENRSTDGWTHEVEIKTFDLLIVGYLLFSVRTIESRPIYSSVNSDEAMQTRCCVAAGCAGVHEAECSRRKRSGFFSLCDLSFGNAKRFH